VHLMHTRRHQKEQVMDELVSTVYISNRP
jgi:hypothetical protein